MADVLIKQLGAPRFSWGGNRSLVDALLVFARAS